MSHTGRVIVGKLTCNTTWAGILDCTDLSRPKLELIRPSGKVSPLLEIITAGVCFRIQWILWSCRSLSIEILLTNKKHCVLVQPEPKSFEVLLILNSE